MRRLSTLLSRQPSDRATGADHRRTGADAPTAAAKPPRKRCLNEGGHKLYR